MLAYVISGSESTSTGADQVLPLSVTITTPVICANAATASTPQVPGAIVGGDGSAALSGSIDTGAVHGVAAASL